MMNRKRITLLTIILLLCTAAVTAAVFLSGMMLPGYSRPVNKTVNDEETGITIAQDKRKLEVSLDKEKIWELPAKVLAQDFLFEDIDRDGNRELIILCWKRGRYGNRRPVWVKHDEIWWSQHIYIYRITEGKVIPKWMASDIGMKAASFEYEDGAIVITDTNGHRTKWKWISWGLEKVW